MLTLLEKAIIFLLTNPEIFTNIEATVAEISSHDPRSQKVQTIGTNLSALTLALTKSRAIQNGANGD